MELVSPITVWQCLEAHLSLLLASFLVHLGATCVSRSSLFVRGFIRQEQERM